jgi:hypothetical protein
MLTKAEKKWLERKYAEAVEYGHYSCPSCKWLGQEDNVCIFRRCLIFDPKWQDAAEFEARVAAKLSIREDRLTPCILDPNPETHGECKQWRFYWRNSYAVYWGCAACRLKHARLAVEEEMEKERK